jgi:hypothetical protein
MTSFSLQLHAERVCTYISGSRTAVSRAAVSHSYTAVDSTVQQCAMQKDDSGSSVFMCIYESFRSVIMFMYVPVH